MSTVCFRISRHIILKFTVYLLLFVFMKLSGTFISIMNCIFKKISAIFVVRRLNYTFCALFIHLHNLLKYLFCVLHILYGFVECLSVPLIIFVLFVRSILLVNISVTTFSYFFNLKKSLETFILPYLPRA